MGTDLLTLDSYKAYAMISNPNSDAELNAIIPRVSAFVKTYCKRTFIDYATTPKVEVHNGNVAEIILSESPVISVDLVEYSSDYGQTYTPLTEFIDWVEDSDSIVSISAAGFPKALRGYRITYTAGYTVVPSDLQLALFDMVTYYRRNDSSVHSTKAPGTNSVQVEFISTTSLPAHIRRVLDLYRADFA